MPNYKIKMSFDIIGHLQFEIVPPNFKEPSGFGDGWIFNTLSEAKEEGRAYLREQDRWNNVISQNEIIRPLAQINNTRLCDLWNEFWDNYEDLEKLTNAMTKEEYNTINQRTK